MFRNKIEYQPDVFEILVLLLIQNLSMKGFY